MRTVPEVHLDDEDRLRIRLGAVSVDSIPRRWRARAVRALLDCARTAAVLRDADLQRAVVAEADMAFEPGFPDRDSLRRMVQTRCAAMETLRLHPPAPALTRITASAFEFQGYRIPENEICLVANTVTHHLPECFPDPQRFDVSRYAPARQEHLQPNVYCAPTASARTPAWARPRPTCCTWSSPPCCSATSMWRCSRRIRTCTLS